MADGPIEQDVSQATDVMNPPAQPAPEAIQPPMTSGAIQNAPQPDAQAPPVSQVAAGAPQTPPQLGTAATAQPSYKESALHKLGGVLAGGTHNTTYKVNPETGEIGVELRPKTGREEIMSSVANILSGMAAGAGKKHFGEGFAAGAAQVTQQIQQRQQQGKQDAVDNYNLQQQAKVQKAQAMHANLQMASLAMDVGRKGREDHKTMVDTYADAVKDLKELNIDGADKEISEDDAKKLDPAKFVGYPVDTVPRLDPKTNEQAKDANGVPLWNNTYIAVSKDARVPTSDEDGKPKSWLTQAQSWGVLPDKKVAPQDMRVATAASIMHTVASLNSMNTELNNFYGKLNGDKKPGSPGYIAPIDLKSALKADPALKDALQKFQLTAGMSTQPDIQVDALRQKDPQAAAKIANLFGPDNLEKFKEDRLAATKASQTAAEETARLKAKQNDPLEQQRLKNEKLTGQKAALEIQKLQKDLTGFDLSKISTAPLESVSNPDGSKAGATPIPDPNYRVNQSILDQMGAQDAGLAATIKAIGEGREVMTPQAQRTKDGQAILKAVNLAYPDYNAVKVQSYLKGRETGTSGTLGNKVNSFATAMDHLQRYYDNINALSSTYGVGAAMSALGVGTAKELETDRTALASEIASAYKGGGVASEPEIKEWREKLGGPTVWAQKKGATETAHLLQGKFHEYANQYRNMVPGGLRDDNFQLMSDKAAQSYKHVTGQDIGNIQPFSQGQNQPQQQQAPARPASVPPDYVFNATGPKGAGWYKPTGNQ